MSQHSFQTLADWLGYIEALHPSEIEMGLERIKKVYKRLPQFPDALKIITVAGTNGKGSTVRSVEALSRAMGLNVGSYTSPHLLSYNERVQINQKPISDQCLVDAFVRVEEARGDVQLTYFEFGTLAAFIILAESNLDLVVLEIGLGGRLDAVNIVDPNVAVITTVDMDHEGWLGNTREAIAKEKAGIVRSDSVFVCGDDDPPKALLDAASISKVALLKGRDFRLSFEDGVVNRLSWYSDGASVSANLRGSLPVLPQNLLNGVQALTALGYECSSEVISQSLPYLNLAGRQQVIDEHPFTMVDVGHNPQAATALACRLIQEKSIRKLSRCYCLLGMLSDKNHFNTLAELLHVVDAWEVCELDAGTRAAPASVLEETLLEAGASVGGTYGSPKAAYKAIKNRISPNDMLVVFGSFYTVADILSEA